MQSVNRQIELFGGEKGKMNESEEERPEQEEEEPEEDENVIRVGDIVIPLGQVGNTVQSHNDQGRLIITDIVNENFKSYAGVQSLGPFHKVTD